MKNITLAILTLATVAAGVIADASPAMAQGARFAFEPNTWKNHDGSGKPGRYLNQPRQPMTSVGHGMVPKASSFLGVDPSFLKPAPKPVAPPAPPMVATNVHPSVSWGQPQARIIPKTPQALAATPYNPLFGAAPTKPAVVAQVPQQAPAARLAPPSASKNLSGRMVPRSHSQAKHAVAGRLLQPKQPRGLDAKPKVASYGNQFFKSGSTKPSASFNSDAAVYGQIIHK
ncbi:MAG: hypothetical protein SGJ27_04480 [Candidatus Melainabacteria bacterium]|nr:hypothetical protein [Candidatus Melainabacteria bacterium]